MAENLVDDNTVKTHAEEFAAGCLYGLEMYLEKFDYSKFYNWYSRRLGQSFSLQNLDKLEFDPSDLPNANFFQKVMRAMDMVREPHILKIIGEQLMEFNRVLVVYGSAHQVKHEPVLAKILGAPSYAKPF